jgi:homoserine/homoserine lactone efflux protein
VTVEIYLAFIATTAMLISIPGPNVALIVANSVEHGRRFGFLTVAGTSAAMVPQLVLTTYGMTGALLFFSHLFEWIRWIGVAYLVYLGILAIQARPIDLTKIRPEPRSPRAIFLRGFLVSLTNPKTLLFYGAFFPQFVDASGNVAQQLWLLSVTFLAIAIILDAGWALAGGRLRGLLAGCGVLRNRLAGGFHFAAALGLAGARRGE